MNFNPNLGSETSGFGPDCMGGVWGGVFVEHVLVALLLCELQGSYLSTVT